MTFSEGATTLATVAVDGSGQASFSTSSLAPGATHTVVATYNPTGGWATSSGNVLHTVNPDVTAPTAPTGLSATPGAGTGQVTLNWTASTDIGGSVAYYEVWRGNKATGAFTLIASPAGTTYVDTPGRNTKRFYYVVAVDTSGNKSAPSATVAGTGKR